MRKGLLLFFTAAIHRHNILVLWVDDGVALLDDANLNGLPFEFYVLRPN